MEIKLYNKNAKLHPAKQIDALAKVVKEIGWRQPVVVNQKGVIIVGHGRWMVWEKHKELPEIWVIDDKGETIKGAPDKRPLTEAQEKMWRIADNQLNLMTGFDNGLLIEELKSLDLNMQQLTGIDLDILKDLQEDNFDAEAEYNKIKEPETKRGEVYELGEHRLLCGDATKEEDFKTLMAGKLADLIFTDPPYNVDYKSPGGLDYASTKFGGTGGKIFNDDKTDEECLEFYSDTLKNLHKFSKDSVTIYWWFANRNNAINRQAFEIGSWHMSQIIIWLKNSMVFSRGQDYHRCYEPCMVGWKKKKTHYKNKAISNLKDVFSLDKENLAELADVWYEHRDLTTAYVHPTQKPIRLAQRALRKNSQLGDVVVDAFGGSGSTLIGCEQMKRIAYLMEMDPKYCDVICKRYEQFSGKKVKKVKE